MSKRPPILAPPNPQLPEYNLNTAARIASQNAAREPFHGPLAAPNSAQNLNELLRNALIECELVVDPLLAQSARRGASVSISIVSPGPPCAQGCVRAVRIGAGIRVIDPAKSRSWKRAAQVHMAEPLR